MTGKPQMKKLSEFKIGDLVTIQQEKTPLPVGKIVKFYTTGCQLHGDPIDKVYVDIITPGHSVKKRNGYSYHADTLAEIAGDS